MFLGNVQTLVLDEFDTMLDSGSGTELVDIVNQVLNSGKEQASKFGGNSGEEDLIRRSLS